jgi:hypothetical protein|tara:strand:+ start:122 stop:553 length:432 start_codon:yes stop_codon:yes gene_type:complete
MLYEQDLFAWTQQQVNLLTHQRWHELDVENLIDELEGMARRDRREMINRLIILIAHLLKWEFQPDHQSGSWRGSIQEQRLQLNGLLEDSPSLHQQFIESLEKAYPQAVKLASKETELPTTKFPNECPYELAQLLDEDFLPSTA